VNRGVEPSLREPGEWLRSGNHLPEFMRDFHDQKELFKALQEVVERRNEKPNSYTEGLTWIAAHVYTVDVFLWVLAKHGYTLQRSRQRLRFADITEFVGASTERWRANAAEVLGLAFQKARKDGSSQIDRPGDPNA